MLIKFESWPENMKTNSVLSDYYHSLDPEYLVNRVETEYIDCLHTGTANASEADVPTDWTFGRLQSWYAGRELSNLGNVVDFSADRDLQQLYRSTPVNHLLFSQSDGGYSKTNTIGLYNEAKKR